MNPARSSPFQLAQTLASLSLHSPLVIASRTLQFAQPGALLSATGQAEFFRMFAEKQAAAAESYFAMVMSAFSLSQQLLFGAWSSWARGQTPQWSAHAMANTANSALRPYQRRARANARRLSRSRKPG